MDGLCGTCGWRGARSGSSCPNCHSNAVLGVSDGAVVVLPAGTEPCPACGSDQRDLLFRSWVRITGMIVMAREERSAAYLCRECARERTAKHLVLTGLFGWWSVTAFLFYAPRATYHNWRSIWSAPKSPATWGALDTGTLFATKNSTEQADA